MNQNFGSKSPPTVEQNGVAAERRQAYEKLRISEALLKEAQAIARLGSFKWNARENYLWWSDETFRIYGKIPGEFEPSFEGWMSCIHPDDLAPVLQSLDALTASVGEAEHEYRLVRDDGAVRWAHARVRVCFDRSGEQIGLEGTCQDITERKQKDDKLRASEARTSLLIQAANVGLWDWNLTTNEVYFSPEWKMQLGYPDHELQNQFAEWETRLHPEDHSIAMEAVRDYLNGTRPTFKLEFRLRHKKGSWRWIYAQAHAERDSAGKPLRMMGCHLDITDQKTAAAERDEALSRLEKIASRVPGVVYQYRLCPDGTASFPYASDGMNDLLANSSAGAGKALSKLFRATSAEAAESLQGSIRKSAEDLSPWTHEFQIRDSGGKERWLFANSVPERESDGSTLWHGYLADISERKQAEQALRRSRGDLTEAQRIAHIGSWYLDIASGEVTWSDELYRMYGFNPDFPPPPYCQHAKLFTPEAWTRLSAALANSRDTGIPYELELEMVRQNGSHGWIWVRGEAVFDVAGTTIGMRGVAQDVTDRKRAEAALRESETRLRIVTGCVRVGLVAADREHRYTFSNDAYCAILGLDKSSIVGQRIADVLPDVYEERVRPKLDQAFTGERVEYEFQRQTSRGTVHCVVNYEPVMEENVVSSVVAVVMDVTAQRNIEEQLRQSQKMETIGQLAGGIAHDFNNLLTIISGNTDLLLMTCAHSAAVVGVLQEIQSAGRRAAELTQKLLAFSRQQVRSPESLDLNSIIVETQTLLQRSVGRGVVISYALGEKLNHVWMDRSELTQVLLNLAINARDAMGNEGQLSIETQRVEVFHHDATGNTEIEPGAYNLLIVSDSGCGIVEHMQARIFEPFFTTKPVGMGTGLGLSMVHGIVTGSGGAIHVSSTVGEGTTFSIYLPDTAKPEHVPVTNSTATLPQGGVETLLLVEDDDSVRRLSRIILTDYGYNVIEARNGVEALQIFRDIPGRFKMLVTDIKMPDMTGTVLAEKIRNLQPEIRVLFTSGYIAETETRHALLDLDVSFLQKPFSPRELAEKVRSVLDSANL